MKSNLFRAAVVVTAALALTACTGGGTGGGGATGGETTGAETPTGGAGSPVTIEFQTNLGATDPILDVLTEVTAGFEAEHEGVTIELVPMTDTYEGDIKVRLASNDAPDIWSTHGWSLLRYSEFLEPLSGQPWAASFNEALAPAMKNADGEFFALPANTDVAGVVYNKTVLADAGVDPAALTDWAAFTAALETLKTAGVVPISASGKDSWFAGNVADFLGSGAFTADELAGLTEGTFAAQGYTALLEQVSAWAQAGYFNPDYSSATMDDLARALGQGDTAFVFTQNYLVGSALGFSPDAQLGYLPVPGNVTDPYLVGGEGYAYGVSKASPNKDVALEYLAYLAQPENLGPLATAIGGIPGLTDAVSDLGPLQDSYDTFVAPGDHRLEPYFDRVYLPNGMWDTMVTTTDAVITGQSDVASAVAQVEAQFATLYGQQ